MWLLTRQIVKHMLIMLDSTKKRSKIALSTRVSNISSTITQKQNEVKSYTWKMLIYIKWLLAHSFMRRIHTHTLKSKTLIKRKPFFALVRIPTSILLRPIVFSNEEVYHQFSRSIQGNSSFSIKKFFWLRSMIPSITFIQ